MNNHNKLKQDTNSPLANNNANSLISNTQINTLFRMSPHPSDNIPLDTNEKQLQIVSISRTTSYDLLSELINNYEIIYDQSSFDEFDYTFEGNDLDSMEINSPTMNPTLGLHNFSQTLRDDNSKIFQQNKDQLHLQKKNEQQQEQQKKSVSQEQINFKEIELNPIIFEPIDTTDLFFNDKNNFDLKNNSNNYQNKIDFGIEPIFSKNSTQSQTITQNLNPNQNTIYFQTEIEIKKDKDPKSQFIPNLIKNFSFNNQNELVSMENYSPLTNSFEKKLIKPEFDQIMELCDEKRKTKIVLLREQYESELNELNQAKNRYMIQMTDISTPVGDVLKNKGGIEKIQEKFNQSFLQLNQKFKDELNQIKNETFEKEISKSRLFDSKIIKNEHLYKDNFQIPKRKRNYPKQLNRKPTNYKIKKSNIRIIQTKPEIIYDSKQQKQSIPKYLSQPQSRSRSPSQSKFDYETQTNLRSKRQLDNEQKDLVNKRQTKKKSRKKRTSKSKSHLRSKKKSKNLNKSKLKKHHNEKVKNNSSIKPKSSKLMLKRRRRCKRLRTTDFAKKIFEEWFQDHYNDEGGAYPSKEIRFILAEKSQTPELQVQRWFGQRRRIEKDKFKNSEIGKPKWV
ncbi:protein son [Anaeramoeba flamelloides]|uniref:Protein son n=1 Tax=Anaeramoeba flamelloides TaxID=1746091 RepID=A0AAV7Y7U5_9EUKA|nr:protein son [Anaeramoeba flamelloides]